MNLAATIQTFRTFLTSYSNVQMVEMKDLKVYTPACMPASGLDFTGETAWVYGWGSTEMGGNIADTLRFFTSSWKKMVSVKQSCTLAPPFPKFCDIF